MLLDLLNGASYLMLASAASYAVLSPRVQLNLLLHVGLVLVAVGCIGNVLIALGPYPPERALEYTGAIVNAGLLLCVAGYWRRMRGQRCHQRRASDWVRME